MGAVTIRPLAEEDLDAVVEVMVAAMSWLTTDAHRDYVRRRTGAFLATDPDGCWVADGADGVTGMATAHVRDGIWVLSGLAVHPDRHAQGTGGRLLRAALGTADDARGAMICSSEDPRAMRLYARAGFGLRPTVGLGGVLARSALPASLRAVESDEVEHAAALGGPVRGGAYGPDDLAMAASRPGHGLLLAPGRGFALHDADGHVAMLTATDEDAATDLLLSCFARAPAGGTVEVDYLTQGQDWAVRACLGAGLALSASGPVFTRGDLGPLRPWIPSGALL